jgi:hypothetical protein
MKMLKVGVSAWLRIPAGQGDILFSSFFEKGEN